MLRSVSTVPAGYPLHGSNHRCFFGRHVFKTRCGNPHRRKSTSIGRAPFDGMKAATRSTLVHSLCFRGNFWHSLKSRSCSISNFTSHALPGFKFFSSNDVLNGSCQITVGTRCRCFAHSRRDVSRPRVRSRYPPPVKFGRSARRCIGSCSVIPRFCKRLSSQMMCGLEISVRVTTAHRECINQIRFFVNQTGNRIMFLCTISRQDQ